MGGWVKLFSNGDILGHCLIVRVNRGGRVEAGGTNKQRNTIAATAGIGGNLSNRPPDHYCWTLNIITVIINHHPLGFRREISSTWILKMPTVDRFTLGFNRLSLEGNISLHDHKYFCVYTTAVSVPARLQEKKHRKNCECCPGHSLTVSQPSKSLSL